MSWDHGYDVDAQFEAYQAEERRTRQNRPYDDVMVEFRTLQAQASNEVHYTNRCVSCKTKVTGPEWREALGPGHVYSETGKREFSLTGLCEWCFDKATLEPPEPDPEVPGSIPRVLRKVQGWTSSQDPSDGGREIVTDITRANVVTSEIKGKPGHHAPVLDLDIPHTYVPSTTEGHGHLYLDVELDWGQMFRLLVTLSELGIIEEGYASASIERGYSAVRLPWVRKGDQ